MPFQHTQGDEGLAQFVYNCVSPDQSDLTAQICASINVYLLCVEGQAHGLTVGMCLSHSVIEMPLSLRTMLDPPCPMCTGMA